MSYGLIYKITNLTNSKIYVGQTRYSIEYRWYGHTFKARQINHRSYLQNAIRKYGTSAFAVCKIATADNQKELDDLEIFWIAFCRSKIPLGYNMNDGGGGSSNPSKEVRLKISRAAKIRKPHFGFKHSEETKRKISLSKMGEKIGPFSLERRQKMSLAQQGLRTGTTLSDETKRKIAISVSGDRNGNYGKRHPGLNAGKKNPMYGRKCPWTAARNRTLIGDANPMRKKMKACHLL
jgi:group I intron endonuclease